MGVTNEWQTMPSMGMSVTQLIHRIVLFLAVTLVALPSSVSLSLSPFSLSVAELQAAGEVPIGAFPITLHPPLPTVTLSTSQPQETSQTGGGQGPILVQPAPQDSQVSSSVFNGVE